MHFSNALLLGIAVYALRLDVKVKPYLETNSLLSALNLLTQLNLRAVLIPSAIVCGGARATPSTGTAVIVFTARQGHISTTTQLKLLGLCLAQQMSKLYHTSFCTVSCLRAMTRGHHAVTHLVLDTLTALCFESTCSACPRCQILHRILTTCSSCLKTIKNMPDILLSSSQPLVSRLCTTHNILAKFCCHIADV